MAFDSGSPNSLTRLGTKRSAYIAPLLKENAGLAAAFAKSAQHGLEILHRNVAAQVAPNIGPKGQLLQLIRNIFRF